MVKMFKKLVCASLLSLGALSATAANAGNMEGDLCLSLITNVNAKFKCSYLFESEYVTIEDIYKKGYRVVAMNRQDKSFIIAIEKQN